MIHHQASGVDFGSHVGQHKLDGLTGSQGLSKSHPLLGIRDGFLEGGLGDTQRQRADADTPTIQHLQRLIHSLANIAQQVFARHPDVFVSNGMAMRGAQPHLLLRRAHVQPRGVGGHHNQAEAVAATLRRSAHQSHDVIGVA